MSNVIISPEMNMPVPVVGVDTGPDWANNINSCLSIVDGHDHSSGKGVPITPAGMNINDDLPMSGNNLTETNSVMFESLNAALTALLRSLQVVGVDLYYIDGNGNSVRITQSGSVTGATGTITGLPSGTASASYSAGTFTFQSATSTPATMAVGPLVIGSATASSKTVTLAPSSSQPSNYNLTFPLAAPSANQAMVFDGSGNGSWTWGFMPIGSVIATFPNLTGAYSTSATTAADAYGFVKCNGQTISDASSPMNGQVVPNINNSIFLMGSTTAGTSGGSATASGVGAHTHTFTSSTSVASSSHTHDMYHVHQWAHGNGGSSYFAKGLVSASPSTTSITGSDTTIITTAVASGISPTYYATGPMAADVYTAGVISGPSGSGSSAQTGSPSGVSTVSGTTDSSGTSFSIVPPYISAVYLMRIK